MLKIAICDDEKTFRDAAERTLLENIQKSQKGRTCIVTTHRPSVLSICQRAYLIQDQTVTPAEES